MNLKNRLGLTHHELMDSFIHQLKVEGLWDSMITSKGEDSARAAINNVICAVWCNITCALEEVEDQEDATVGELDQFLQKHSLLVYAHCDGGFDVAHKGNRTYPLGVVRSMGGCTEPPTWEWVGHYGKGRQKNILRAIERLLYSEI